MFNEIIFVDFENFTKIIDDIKKKDAKIVVLAGLKQADKPFTYAKELLDSVSSVELLKVKATGKNALDFFIAYYLGVYTSRNKELKFKICSNDKGYDPLITHLHENGISIERLEFKSQSDLFKTDDDYKKAFNNISKMANETRPKKIKSLTARIRSLTIGEEKAQTIINELKKHNYIDVENGKVEYKNM
jgi:hypothetical protein